MRSVYPEPGTEIMAMHKCMGCRDPDGTLHDVDFAAEIARLGPRFPAELIQAVRS